jgi:2-oxoisovalerate dehydrogenase E2 component (dihydrolipoyl transacylase)
VGVFNFKLPDVGEGTAEAEITAWHVKVGDRVAEDQPLVDVMTDKATVEITSPVAGTVQAVNGEPGAMAPVGSVIVVFEVEGAGNASAGAPPQSSAAPPTAPPQAVEQTPAPSSPPPQSGGGGAEGVGGGSPGGNYVFKLPDVGEGTAEAEIVAWRVKAGRRRGRGPAHRRGDDRQGHRRDDLTGRRHGGRGRGRDRRHGRRGLAARLPPGRRRREHGRQDCLGAGSGHGARPVAPKPPTVSDAPAPASCAAPAGGLWPRLTPLDALKSASASAGKHGFQTRAPARSRWRRRLCASGAMDLGVQLQFVPGSGPAGRITHEDLDAYMANPTGAAGQGTASARPSGYAQREGVEDVRVIGLRRKIAEKMQEAKRRIPHFMYAEEIDATELEALRLHLNASKKPDQPKLTLLPFFVRALVKVLPEHPQINAIYDDEAGVLHRHAAVHCGIATQTPNGLMVPVVRHAEALDVWQTANEIARVSGAAKSGKAAREELSGSTITVTSLGPLGGVVHTPVINHPEVAIVGPNKIIDRPVVRNGAVTVRKMMNLSSSFDHRIVDGYDAAEFIQKIKGLLEHPATLFME